MGLKKWDGKDGMRKMERERWYEKDGMRHFELIYESSLCKWQKMFSLLGILWSFRRSKE